MKKRLFIVLLAVFVFCIGFAAFGIASFAEITKQPQSNVFPEYADASYSCDSDDGEAIFRWHIIFDGKDYDIENADFENDPWVFYSESGFGTSADGKSLYFEGVLKQLSGAQVYCVVLEHGAETATNPAYVVICDQGGPSSPEITVPVRIKAEAGKPFTLTVGYTSRDETSYEIIWYSTGTGVIEDIKALTDNPTANSETLSLTPEKAGTYYYCAAVKATKGTETTVSYSSIIEVTVKEPEPTEAAETPTPTPTPTPDGAGKETPTPENTVTPAPTETGNATDVPETQAPDPTPTEAPSPTETPLTTPKPNGSGTNNWFRTYTIIIVIAAAVIIIAIVVISLKAGKNGGKSKGKGKGGKKGGKGKKRR